MISGLAISLGATLVLTSLLLAKPRTAFLAIFGGLTLFNAPFIQRQILSLGTAKVYVGDLVMVSLFAFVFLRVLLRGISFGPASNVLICFFLAWGIFEIARGIPQYGYSAVGEARWYVLPISYYLFVIAAFRTKHDVLLLGRWFLLFLSILVPSHLVYYYFLGGYQRVPPAYLGDPRTIFRFVNGVEALLLAFALVSVVLFHVSGQFRKHKALLYLSLVVLELVIVITQIRTVWIAAAAGLGICGASLCYRLRSRRLSLSTIALTAVLLLVPIPVARFVVASVGERAPSVTATGQIPPTSISPTSISPTSISPTSIPPTSIPPTSIPLTSIPLTREDALSDPTGSWRIVAWQQELAVAFREPIAGQGFGGYSHWYDGAHWQRVAVHNDYIMIFSKTGLVGLFLLLGAVSLWLLEVEKYIRTETEVYSSLLGRAIQICVIMHLIYAFFFGFTSFFWILLGVGTVLRGVREAKPLSRLLVHRRKGRGEVV